MIRKPQPNESVGLLDLAEATGIFKPGEVAALLGGVLQSFHAGSLGTGHEVFVWADEEVGVPAGWVYFAPSSMAPNVWDLWWIGVAPAHQHRGIGGKLLTFVEQSVLRAGARILLIETSASATFDPVRQFYATRGYTDCGTVPDFYGEGDGKVTYVKKLQAS